jgi:hypothetical protein
MYGAQQFFGGSPQQVRSPVPQQYLSYGGYSYVPTQSSGFDMNSMMNMMMMIMMMSMMVGMMKPMMGGLGGTSR